MKKDDLKKVVRKTLFMAVFALLFFVIVLFGSRFLDKKYEVNDHSKITPVPDKNKQLPEVVAEMLFVISDEGALDGLYITELDCINQKWRMTAIPLDTRLSVSTVLYREFVKINVSAPQITTVSELYKYFDKSKAVDFVLAALLEQVPVKIQHTLQMPTEVFYTVFRRNPETYEYSYFLREDFEQTLKSFGSMKNFMKNTLEQCICDPTAQERMYYLETFEGLTNGSVSCRLIPGERHNNGYEIRVDTNDFFVR